jgi:enoyl-CoA hydratase
MVSMLSQGSRAVAAISSHARLLTTAAAEAPVLISREGGLINVTLNRPKALNALNLDMIRLLLPAIHEWRASNPPSCVVLQGSGDKSFCAGGDIKSLFGDGIDDADPAAQEAFFREEYTLDYSLAMSNKHVAPHVAILDGVTMGGGVGVSVFSDVRIATERLVFAMPEAGIGLFPDVGGSFFLPRLPTLMGEFLALTGAKLRGAQAVCAGVATHYVPSSAIPDLLKELQGTTSRESVKAVVPRRSSS